MKKKLLLPAVVLGTASALVLLSVEPADERPRIETGTAANRDEGPIYPPGRSPGEGTSPPVTR